MSKKREKPLAMIGGVPLARGRVTMMTIAHDATCPALKTQRADDCRCEPDVTIEQLPVPEKPKP